jgi:hypothetical protein
LKSKILHISSFLLLFTFISLLIVSSASILSQEEENEEIIEIVLEDFFDEEGVFEVKFFLSNWLSNFNLELDSFDLLLNANIHLLGDYSQITQSIPYPPPEK